MPKRNQDLENFYHHFDYEEAEMLRFEFDRICRCRDVADSLTLTTAITQLANKISKDTGSLYFLDTDVKQFISNNLKLHKEFMKYVNETKAVKYNPRTNRVIVGVDYWDEVKKENPTQKLFRECGFPDFDWWSSIIVTHRPGEVIMGEVGSSANLPFVVKEESFDTNAVDVWMRYFPPRGMKYPLNPEKISVL